MISAHGNATFLLFAVSCFVLVSFVKSFRVSKASNVSSVKGHCTGFHELRQLVG